ncbi:MAG: flagellar hook-associated protein FlgL [Oscillospiraceae bacterium]|nr:flagellar hook-associated protein FlgL [Oscillospiraceae bacterium]
MRITNNRITRNYLFNANKNLQYYSESSNKLTTGRAFTRVSQNVSGGKKAMRLRTQLYQNAQFQKNVSTANEKLTIAEQSLREMSDIITSVQEQATRGGGVSDAQAKEILASTVDELKATVLQYANCTYVDEYVFGGTNAKTAPFTKNENDEIMYNGSLVKDITKNADGVYVDADGNEVDFSERIYIDIGLGMVNLTEGDIDTNSAYDTSFSGLECLGFGMSEFTYVNDDGVEVTETFPNNIYDIATEISKALENNETQKVSALSDQLSKSHNNLLKNVADLGVRTQYLERTLTMLKDEEVNIQTMQTELEGINDTEEIVKMNEYKYAWMLTLQFGGNLLPQSLMDFLK